MKASGEGECEGVCLVEEVQIQSRVLCASVLWKMFRYSTGFCAPVSCGRCSDKVQGSVRQCLVEDVQIKSRVLCASVLWKMFR